MTGQGGPYCGSRKKTKWGRDWKRRRMNTVQARHQKEERKYVITVITD